jgi:hypothetical protein
MYATITDTTTVADACDPLPASTPDLASYVVVIRRDTCFFTQKIDNAAAFGSRYFLTYGSRFTYIYTDKS